MAFLTNIVVASMVLALHASQARFVPEPEEQPPSVEPPTSFKEPPLVDFKLDMPLHLQDMDQQSIDWIINHQSLIDDLIFSDVTPGNDETDSVNQDGDGDYSVMGGALQRVRRDANSALDKYSPVNRMAYLASKNAKRQQLLPNRRPFHRLRCDINNATLGMLLEYLKTGTVCGLRVANFRFGK